MLLTVYHWLHVLFSISIKYPTNIWQACFAKAFHVVNLSFIQFFVLLILCQTRVQIIASQFANFEVNSSYCDCKVVNHKKIVKHFFYQGKFNSSKLYFSTLYPHFIHPLHTIMKRDIHAKDDSQFLITIFACDKVKALLHSFLIEHVQKIKSEMQKNSNCWPYLSFFMP